MEKLLDTPARIYYKYEGVSPAGSHKPNTAVPQVWYNAKEGVKNVVTETGAGQWGCSLAFACSLFGLDCEVGRTQDPCKWLHIFNMNGSLKIKLTTYKIMSVLKIFILTLICIKEP